MARALRELGPLSRAELQDATGLSRTTLHAVVGDLLTDGVILERHPDAPRGRGRPVARLVLNARAAALIGVEIGRGHIGVVSANLTHEFLGGASAPFDLTRDAEVIASATVDAIAGHIARESLVAERVASIVIGTPLFFGADAGFLDRVQSAIAARLVVDFGVHPVFENNARLVALAEMRFGAAVDVDDLLYIHLDEGVGGGIVLGGRIVEGAASGRAGELGHVSVAPDGPPCWCGGRGCLERFVALGELAEATGASVADLVREPLAQPVVRDRVPLIAQVLAGQLTALDLRRVVLGGALGTGPGIAKAVHALVRELVPRHVRDGLDVRPAQLGPLGSARGGIVRAMTSTSGAE